MGSRRPRAVAASALLLCAALAGRGPARACTDGDVVAEGCHPDLQEVGCCASQALYWCEDGQTCRRGCLMDLYCGWNLAEQRYTCGTAGGEDGTGTYPRDCPDDEDGDGSSFPDDCDDTNPDVHPGADEICDGVDDNDCDGVDDPAEIDHDGDGYSKCTGDCDDGAPDVYPGAPDACGDGVDSDCGGDLGDEIDDDGDGYLECGGPAGEPDCDDTRATVHPGMDEVCRDGLDNDCDGNTDGYDDECQGGDDGGGSSGRSGPYGLSCSAAPVPAGPPDPAASRWIALLLSGALLRRWRRTPLRRW